MIDPSIMSLGALAVAGLGTVKANKTIGEQQTEIDKMKLDIQRNVSTTKEQSQEIVNLQKWKQSIDQHILSVITSKISSSQDMFKSQLDELKMKYRHEILQIVDSKIEDLKLQHQQTLSASPKIQDNVVKHDELELFVKKNDLGTLVESRIGVVYHTLHQELTTLADEYSKKFGEFSEDRNADYAKIMNEITEYYEHFREITSYQLDNLEKKNIDFQTTSDYCVKKIEDLEIEMSKWKDDCCLSKSDHDNYDVLKKEFSEIFKNQQIELGNLLEKSKNQQDLIDEQFQTLKNQQYVLETLQKKIDETLMFHQKSTVDDAIDTATQSSPLIISSEKKSPTIPFLKKQSRMIYISPSPAASTAVTSDVASSSKGKQQHLSEALTMTFTGEDDHLPPLSTNDFDTSFILN